jgi:alkylated DNA repair dioxygenase AlkB
MQNRRVAQYGCRYDYQLDIVDTATQTPPIPQFLKTVLLNPSAEVLENHDISVDDFSQCIINEYTDPGTIIPWHKDHSDFGCVVLVFTFGDNRPLCLRQTEGGGGFTHYTALPRHGSCYILTGAARYEWEHCVPEGNGRRISFTFRSRKH